MSNDTTKSIRFIDHTILKSEATTDRIKQLCAGAKQYNFAAVCINLALVRLAEEVGIGFVKTCAGFNGGGVTVEYITLMRRTVGPNEQVKTARGTKTLTNTQNMVTAGITRLGASTGVQIAQGAQV
ncbi:hypothetical protein ACFLXQ_03850 [Chloroflexota bacterium]